MKRFITTIVCIALIGLCCPNEAQAQGWLKKIGDKAVERARNRAEEKVEQRVNDEVDEAVDNSFESTEDAIKGNKKDDDNADCAETETESDTEATAKDKEMKVPTEITYSKCDFIAGDEIIFEDNMTGEQLGEFPSQWDLFEGVCEVASINGQNVLTLLERYSCIVPLMKSPKNYLGDKFTVEFDYYQPSKEEHENDWLELKFLTSDEEEETFSFTKSNELEGGSLQWGWVSSNGPKSGSDEFDLKYDEWHHFALSFNKRALKIYIDGIRHANIPNVATPPGWFKITLANGNGNVCLTNFRIAKGAVPLYDRMMSDGKIISYGITFDVGKSVIRPESMGELSRIAKLMNENPDLKFSVEGHTDATGSETSNQALSEARSNAVVMKLVEELGISDDRLTAKGKGQSSPIADNSTDEGRAKNRRVEFVKK